MAKKNASKFPQPPSGQFPTAAEALVIFTDIRGFTKWSEANEVFARLDEFVERFIGLIRESFPEPAYIKGLGDGAMIVQTYFDSRIDFQSLLKEAMSKIVAANVKFDKLCNEFARSVGHATELRLGWGVVRGAVRVLENDYVGSNLNKSARLCDVARPFGIVIDRDDFPDRPVVKGLRFFEQTRRLGGIGEDVRIWATEEIVSKFVTRERLKETPEVHVAGLCIDTNDRRGVRVLLAKRATSRSLFPGLYEGCGGQLARSESFSGGVERHFRLEMGISVRVAIDIHCFYQIAVPNEPLIPGIRFLCHRVGEVEPKSSNHDEVRWVFESDLRDMDATAFIPEMKDQFIILLDQFHKNS